MPVRRRGSALGVRSPGFSSMSIEKDIVTEAESLADAARRDGIALKLVGGLGVHFQSPSARVPPLRRDYPDLDFVTYANHRKGVQRLFEGLGYEPDKRFNALYGQQRLYYWDSTNGRHVDIFVDAIRMCHPIDLRNRLNGEGPTLLPADLFLTKMQIVEINEKDLQDVTALLLDHSISDGSNDSIDGSYVARLLSRSWGFHRTVHLNSARVVESASRFSVPRIQLEHRLSQLWDVIDAVPKSLTWKARARIGDRVRWYTIPEETDR